MKIDDLVQMSRRRPLDVVGSDYRGSIAEAVGTVVLWGGGVFASMWVARWYTLRTLRAKGVIA